MARASVLLVLAPVVVGGVYEFDQHSHTHAASPMHACIPTLISLSIFVYDRYIDYKSSAPRKRERTSSRCLPQA